MSAAMYARNPPNRDNYALVRYTHEGAIAGRAAPLINEESRLRGQRNVRAAERV